MKQYAGIDVSWNIKGMRSGRDGRIIREEKVLSEPDAVIAWFGEHGVAMEQIGLEAAPFFLLLRKARHGAWYPRAAN